MSISPSRLLVRLSQAGVKRLRSVFRDVGVGSVHPHWQARAEICATCPLCVVDRKHTYCGKPLLRQVERDEATEGCGCPILAKARDPAEHCPRNRLFGPSTKDERCDCMWCVGLRSR